MVPYRVTAARQTGQIDRWGSRRARLGGRGKGVMSLWAAGCGPAVSHGVHQASESGTITTHHHEYNIMREQSLIYSTGSQRVSPPLPSSSLLEPASQRRHALPALCLPVLACTIAPCSHHPCMHGLQLGHTCAWSDTYTPLDKEAGGEVVAIAKETGGVIAYAVDEGSSALPPAKRPPQLWTR